MNEQRFERWNDHSCKVKDNQEDTLLNWEDVVKKLNELSDENNILKIRLDYETRMHKRWKDDCLALLEEQDLNDYVKELQKSKKSGWDSEQNTDYVTMVKEGLK